MTVAPGIIAISRSSSFYEFFSLCGAAFVRRGKLRIAERFLTAAHLIDHNDANLIYSLASLHTCLGKLDDAKPLFARDVAILTGNGTTNHLKRVDGAREVRLCPSSR